MAGHTGNEPSYGVAPVTLILDALHPSSDCLHFLWVSEDGLGPYDQIACDANDQLLATRALEDLWPYVEMQCPHDILRYADPVGREPCHHDLGWAMQFILFEDEPGSYSALLDTLYMLWDFHRTLHRDDDTVYPEILLDVARAIMEGEDLDEYFGDGVHSRADACDELMREVRTIQGRLRVL